MNILHITPDFNFSDGRSYYVYLVMKYLKRTGHNVYLCTNEGNSFDRIREFGIPVFIHNSLSRKPSFIKSINYISGLAEENKIDIVHSHHRYYEFLANSIKSSKKLHTVFTALSIVDKRYFVEYRSDNIIAVSECVKAMLMNKFGVKENKITLIPNFADSEEVNHKSSIVNRQSTIVRILSVGRFHKDKNYETLIKSIALIKDYKIKLILVGEGEEKSKLVKIIKEKSVDAELISPQFNLKHFFEIADMCILTSVRDPLPGFMLQSGLHNKPFIGTDVDGISEVIQNGENGLLFEKRNEHQLSERIRLFIENKSIALKCADNLNKLVAEKFTEKSVMPEIIKLYSRFFE